MYSQLWLIPVAGPGNESLVLGRNDCDMDAILTQILHEVLGGPADSVDWAERLGSEQDAPVSESGGEVVIDSDLRLLLAWRGEGCRHAGHCMDGHWQERS